jgi:DNA polymerase-3 subunit gamma/tau
MENYIVSARKYRPQTFESVVGQRSIVMTLKNAIRNNQVAQAFLFCGSRGVGKTSTARILAKTLNCMNRTPEIEACNACPSCNSFNEGSSLNIYELDAASNNSVDDIRILIDQVRIAPQIGSHKVYIIDEVHMLSTSAFNAFLKTLEEPPKHAIFILATTEKHKIIPTILSRCQIFDFNRIKVKDIAQHLSNIAQKEGVYAEPEALHLIAQKADGALRDSLSIFDQIVVYTQGNITYQAVLENLNVLDYDYFFKIVDFAEQLDISSALILFNEIMDRGFDGHNFLLGLSSHYRNILVAKDPATVPLLEVADVVAERYIEQGAKIDTQRILRSIHIVQKAESEFKGSRNQRLLIEWTLMQLCSLNQPSEKKNG